jgi:hypothetical protein
MKGFDLLPVNNKNKAIRNKYIVSHKISVSRTKT